MTTSEPLIELNSVGLALDGRAILKNVSLQVFPGEVLALVGPNGAGKSSLLSVMSGDVQATTGRALLQGRDVSKYRVDEAARQRSVLMQSNEVSFPFTVAEIVEMGRAPWARTTSLADDNKAIGKISVAANTIIEATRAVKTFIPNSSQAICPLYFQCFSNRKPVCLINRPPVG